MERLDRIRNHPLFIREYDRLRRMEQGRVFCGHDLEHFLDVARVSWIRVLEEGLLIPKDVVYAAGLLHDLGKGQQYEFGMPHHQASAELAEKILPECGYTGEETDVIVRAILSHRKKTETGDRFSEILYDADKQTRLCFCCPAQEACNWPEEKRNGKLIC